MESIINRIRRWLHGPIYFRVVDEAGRSPEDDYLACDESARGLEFDLVRFRAAGRRVRLQRTLDLGKTWKDVEDDGEVKP